MAEALGPTPYRRRRDYTLLIVLAFVVVSLGVHVAAFTGLHIWAASKPRGPAAQKPIELVMVEIEPPPPPPPPEEKKPEPPPPPKPKPKPPPVKVAVTEEKPPPPEEQAPPPPNEEAPPETPSKPVPLVVGISMSSTSTSGGFAAPVGNTAYGKVESTAKDPTTVQKYRAPKYAPIYQVDRHPEEIGQVKIPYPAEAKRAGIEGDVILALRIDDAGKVVKVHILSGPGYGLNEAAAEAMRRARFRPATQKGEPVATDIKYRYTFYLD